MTQFAEFRVQVGRPAVLGNDGFGEARTVPILGGTVTGATLTDIILPGGADEQRIRADGLTRIHARYVIRTDDGALIRVDSQGLRHAPLRGDPVDPSQIYFRTVIRLEAASPDYDDLNKTLFLSTGRKEADHVILLLARL